MPEICVVGSINLDIITYVDTYPERGKTVFGEKILDFPGGKGANQAISCARQGRTVHLIGAVGQDRHGETLIANLEHNQVCTEEIRQLHAATGQTTILIDNDAENTIIYVEGANKLLSPEDAAQSIRKLKNCSVLLVQMETDYDTVLEAMKTAKELGVFVILDPAPANNVTDELLQFADLILPNEHEILELTGIPVIDETTAKEAAAILKNKGVKQAILKLGSKGAYVAENNELKFIEAIKVDAIDTVGAGDCYAGALASVLIDQKDLYKAAKYANIVAALKVTQKGAQEGIPTIQQVEEFANARGLEL